MLGILLFCAGVVASLARPGGNVTGLTLINPELSSKRLDLLHDVIPHLRRLAILSDASYAAAVKESDEVQDAARASASTSRHTKSEVQILRRPHATARVHQINRWCGDRPLKFEACTTVGRSRIFSCLKSLEKFGFVLPTCNL